MAEIVRCWYASVAILICSSCVFGQSNEGSETQWPTIRGQRWNGHSLEKGIADAWPSDGPPVLWTRELGSGYSSFVAWDKFVATQYQNLGGQYIICMDADTGITRWQVRYDWPYQPAGVYPGPRSTPTYSDGCLYLTSPSGWLLCVDAATGKTIWSVDLYKAFSAELPGFGYACSPIVLDQKVIVPVGGANASLVAFDRASGVVLWQSGTDPVSYASVLPIRFQGKSLVVGYLQNAIVVHEADTGARLGRLALSAGYDEHSAWPIYQEPYLWISGPFQGGSELLELTGDAKQPIRTVRKSSLLSNDIFSSVLHDGAVFGFDLHEAQAKTHRTSRGIFRCIDFRSGESLWAIGDGRLRRTPNSVPNAPPGTKTDGPPSANIGHATVIVADDKLILMNDLGELILARATRKRYDELGRTSVLSGQMCWTQPALSRSRLFVRNHSRAACLYLGHVDALERPARENALSVRDIPQAAYRDFASLLVGFEPEYMFDLPSLSAFSTWYICSLGLLILAFVASIPPTILTLRCTRDLGHRPAVEFFWFCTIAFIAGAAGTTILGNVLREFIFTWHICPFIAFQIAANRLVISAKSLTWSERVKSIAAGFFLLAVCSSYFLICRRMSLLFEWVFLAGFMAALPIVLAGRFWRIRHPYTRWQFLATLVAFSAFHWSSVAILLLRYRN